MEKFDSPLPKDALFQVWLKMAHSRIPEDGEEENVYDYDDGQRNTVIRKLTWAFGSGELIMHLYCIVLIFPQVTLMTITIMDMLPLQEKGSEILTFARR